ncbi:MAG: M14 family metallopeptidase [Gammaproteobacteria bacterium]
MLKVFHQLPEGLLEADVTELADVLGGPALIHLPGRREQPLFVSTLLHGNETGGFFALQALLRDYRDRELPRALSVFIGNPKAARYGLRALDDQPDYNRVWPGGEGGGTPEHDMMARVVADMAERGLFASIDLHNNSGINPHYACVNRTEQPFLHLAALFSRTVVYFTRPRGVQSLALAPLCPAVTVECGRTGDSLGVRHAREYVEAALHLTRIPDHPVAPHDIDVFHTVATVKVPHGLSIGFGGADTDLRFIDDLDHLNFRELPAGTTLAQTGSGPGRLEAWDDSGRDVGGRYFALDDGQIRTARPVMPSMFTLDPRIIREDCVGYLMERYPLDLARAD